MVRHYLKRALALGAHRLLAGSDGLTRLRVLRGPARGLHLAIDLRVGGEAAYITGRHEPEVSRRVAALVRPGSTVWDCGAYIGYYTMFFARRVGPQGRVVTFEPNPPLLERVRKNAELNRFEMIELVPIAIAGENRTVTLEVTESTNSRIAGAYVGAAPQAAQPAERIEVPAMSLDDAMSRFGAPSLVKLDIEGGETVALPHAHRLALEARPTFFIELHNPEAGAAAHALAIAARYDVLNAASGERIAGHQDMGHHILLLPR